MKYLVLAAGDIEDVSPSMRRAWIEILYYMFKNPRYASPSMRRAWIEMAIRNGMLITVIVTRSPSKRRAWIEIWTTFFWRHSIFAVFCWGRGLKLRLFRYDC